MSGPAVESHLRTHLPRPKADPRFRRVLLEQLLLEAEEGPGGGLPLAHRRRQYLGMVGAALAMGAAVGWWRFRGRSGEAA